MLIMLSCQDPIDGLFFGFFGKQSIPSGIFFRGAVSVADDLNGPIEKAFRAGTFD